MVFKSIIGATCACLAVVSFNVSAAIIEIGGYQYDEETGLEWLDLTFTAGMTLSEAIDTHGSAGWSIANREQFSGMYSKYDDPTDTSLYGLSTGFNDSPTSGNQSVRGSGVLNSAGLNLFAVEFELTRDSFHYTISDTRVDKWSVGYYLDGDDIYGDIYMGGTLAINYIDDHLEDRLISYYDHKLTSAPTTVSPYDSYYGVFMVRDVSAVPVPAAVWLFGSGLDRFNRCS